jgi:hypothetical protein
MYVYIYICIYIVLSPYSLSQLMQMSNISVGPALLSTVLLSHVFCTDPQATICFKIRVYCS